MSQLGCLTRMMLWNSTMPIQTRSSGVLQMPAPIDGLLQRHESSVILALSFGTARLHSTASLQISPNPSVPLPSVRQSRALCERHSPTRPAVPSLSRLSQTALFRCPQLGSGHQTITLPLYHLRLLARPNGVRGLSVCATFDPRGQQRRLMRLLPCATLATPAMLPPILTQPS